MDNQLAGYRADFCDYVYELLQDDMDNTRANAIIDLYDELLDVTEHLKRENFSMKMAINKNESETDAQDKTEEETEALEELEAIHKQVTSQIGDLRKQGKEPKAIEYTIKVCFE